MTEAERALDLRQAARDSGVAPPLRAGGGGCRQRLTSARAVFLVPGFCRFCGNEFVAQRAGQQHCIRCVPLTVPA
jgi:hypothetical protein